MEIIEYTYREIDNQDVIDSLTKKANGASIDIDFRESCGQLFCEIDRKYIKKLCRLLNRDEELSFEYLKCLTAVDHVEYLEMVYCFYSFKNNWSINIKARLDAEKPSVDSITPIYSGADWHERETAEMFGIDIKGHPDLKTLLLAGDEESPPLRKSFEIEWKEKEYIPPEKFE
jgi:NADH-quinone oxidoreductase subunit C